MHLKTLSATLLAAATLSACVTPRKVVHYPSMPESEACDVVDLVDHVVSLENREETIFSEGSKDCLALALALKLDREFLKFDLRLDRARVDANTVEGSLLEELEDLEKSVLVAKKQGLDTADYVQAVYQRRPETAFLAATVSVGELEKIILDRKVYYHDLERVEQSLAYAVAQNVNTEDLTLRFNNLKIIALQQIADYQLTKFEKSKVPLNKYQLKNAAEAIADAWRAGANVGSLLRRLNDLEKITFPCTSEHKCFVATLETDANGGPAMGPTLLP